MERIKENIVKYGRLIIDISVIIEVVAALLWFVISLIIAIVSGSFLGILFALALVVGALLFIVIFNYFVYLMIDIRDNVIKYANK
jgi:hypothetical protein